MTAQGRPRVTVLLVRLAAGVSQRPAHGHERPGRADGQEQDEPLHRAPSVKDCRVPGVVLSLHVGAEVRRADGGVKELRPGRGDAGAAVVGVDDHAPLPQPGRGGTGNRPYCPCVPLGLVAALPDPAAPPVPGSPAATVARVSAVTGTSAVSTNLCSAMSPCCSWRAAVGPGLARALLDVVSCGPCVRQFRLPHTVFAGIIVVKDVGVFFL